MNRHIQDPPPRHSRAALDAFPWRRAVRKALAARRPPGRAFLPETSCHFSMPRAGVPEAA